MAEIRLPDEVAHDDAWRVSFAQALKLGMQLMFFTGEHELESFVRFLRGDPDPVVTGVEGRAALALALRVSDAVTRR